jgi:predicted glycoside hydrolase/deacetylase ChbG (UPF0249 family)
MIQEKKIILCADDYGLNPSISQGIRQLVTKQRLSAVSCMVNMPDIQQQAKQLIDLQANIDIGLHFNLTEGSYAMLSSKQMPSLGKLLLRSQLRLLSVNFIEQELNAQLDKFEQAFARLPDFIDGHQHVHHLPVVRAALLKVYQKRLRQQGSYVRCVVPSINYTSRLKSWVLALTGAFGFKKLLVQHQIPHNLCFGGVYDFSEWANYADLVRNFLAQAPSGSLMMCHPGLEIAQATDSINHARLKEYAYFTSENFEQACEQYRVRLCRYQALN